MGDPAVAYSPSKQLPHCADPGDAAVPAAQLVQALADALEYVPAAQGPVTAERPEEEQKLPTLQLRQVYCPTFG